MAAPLNANHATPFHGPPEMQPFRPPLSMASSAKFDEGYSEDTRSQSGSDMVIRNDSRLGDGLAMEQYSQYPLPDWVLGMSETERNEFAYAILRSLRTSSIADIVDKLNPLLHLDPVLYLPPEITFQIFSYLTPETLLRAATLSRAWRARVLDSVLWRLLFRMEGWTSNMPRIRAFEAAERSRRADTKERKTRRARGTEEMDFDKPSTKKRLCERSHSGASGIRDRLEPLTLVESSKEWPPSWGEQHGAVEADEVLGFDAEDRMEDISYHGTNGVTAAPQYCSRRLVRTETETRVLQSPAVPDPIDPPIRPSLFLTNTAETRVNWQYLYKQKRRLEENWNAGRFTNFQLPHPSYPQEGHTECVYTIQYSGNNLVSGSRDKSVRIWNLDTQRLRLPPLLGHSASVLCLQFDDRPEQDLVVSGGSDCHVILWRFSTGRMIRKLEKAHAESVLNLRFDDQYLVTCSKDKTIKVWNRREMYPDDPAFPKVTSSGSRFPAHIIDLHREYQKQQLHFKPLPEYNVLMILEGHAAAVNAVQIYDGKVVSASGDRTVKIWDVLTGSCMRPFTGHTKGIACVQFDGRRIVSGSSDETVRIFDSATGAEVACLHGHSNLVRTVQAQFGDLPGSGEELEAEARAIDRDYFEARERGLIPTELTREQRRARNAGSRDPKQIFAYGAKLPPGGGGSKWARIVSGSYDETVIIWRKQPDGSWHAALRLPQNEAVSAAGGQPRRPVVQGQNHPNRQNEQHLAAHAAAHPAVHHAQAGAAPPQGGHPAPGQVQVAVVAVPPAIANVPGPGAPVPVQPPTQVPQQPQAAAPNGAMPHHHHHHHPLAGPLNPPGTNSRVFKLQFDARRIICCSQDPTIVGWDFAGKDRDIMIASQFFGDSA